MNNFLALSFVALVLSACAGYTYTNTHSHADLIDRDRFSSEQRHHYITSGGAFRGLD